LKNTGRSFEDKLQQERVGML